MTVSDTATALYAVDSHGGLSPMTYAVAVICLIWYIFIAAVCTIGFVQMSDRFGKATVGIDER